jgi:hypothetical protein
MQGIFASDSRLGLIHFTLYDSVLDSGRYIWQIQRKSKYVRRHDLRIQYSAYAYQGKVKLGRSGSFLTGVGYSNAQEDGGKVESEFCCTRSSTTRQIWRISAWRLSEKNPKSWLWGGFRLGSSLLGSRFSRSSFFWYSTNTGAANRTFTLPVRSEEEK